MTEVNHWDYQFTPAHSSQNFYNPRGGARQLFYDRSDEVLIEGPAGTGKSRGALEKILVLMDKYPGSRGIMCRKTRASLTQTTMVTWERKVLPARSPIYFHGGDQEYRHPNGSIFAVAGLDKPQKIMSSEWDYAYLAEATEANEEDAETLTVRLRNGRMPFQQLIMDCNPGPPTHWLNNRCNRGQTTRILSRHRDNPEYFNDLTQKWTEAGKRYLKKLRSLSGVRFWRLFKGIWRAAEGLVWEAYNQAVHVRNRPDKRNYFRNEWIRIWSVDFGLNNPFVWQEWVIDSDKRMWRTREIYMTGRLVEDHARRIRAITAGEPAPLAVVCDHDAEGRLTLEKYLGLKTVPAFKTSVLDGLEAVGARFRLRSDGAPGIYFLRDSLDERDPVLTEARLPVCTEDELEGYVWAVGSDGRRKEVPLDRDNHGCDATRYATCWVDNVGGSRLASSGGVKQGGAF